jgi:hypothetical protein
MLRAAGTPMTAIAAALPPIPRQKRQEASWL